MDAAKGEVIEEGIHKYILYKDAQGIQRRKYITYCIDCLTPRYVQKSKVNLKQRCKTCAAKVPVTEEAKKKISETLRKKYQLDPEFKQKVIDALPRLKGDKHWNWKGGITPLTQQTRTSEDANKWKFAVLYRDSFTCRCCGSKERVQAHHINSWASYPEDRYVIENGMTLCHTCHTLVHKYIREIGKNETRKE